MATDYGRKFMVNVSTKQVQIMELSTAEKAEYDKQQYNANQLALRLADPLWPTAAQLLQANTLALTGNVTLLNQLNANIAIVVAKYPLLT